MKDFDKKLGAKIKRLRDSRGLSQEEAAKAVGINRVSFSQIENGERKITAEEITKLSRVFSVDADILLDFKKDMVVTFEKEATATPKAKVDIRISVPQKNLRKFKEVLLYILNKIGSKPHVGETVLYKILYFIDFDFYERYEEQLIGATYQKNHYGPTPVEFAKVIEEMKAKGDLAEMQSQYFQYPLRKYLPVREPDLSGFKAYEIKTIDEVLEKLSDMNAKQISEYSHGDVPWQTTENGQVIDYESVFYRIVPYSVRKYSDSTEDI